MALKDMVKNVANEAVQKTSDSFKGSNVMQGVLNNYSEYPLNQANDEYGCYLMNNENFKKAFKLIRDVLLFTDKRIIFIDKTGITGSKAKVTSINYFSIVGVEVHTAGFRFDDSDLDVTYISTPNLHSYNTEYSKIHLEFPRKFPVHEIYTELQEYAYENCLRLNSK